MTASISGTLDDIVCQTRDGVKSDASDTAQAWAQGVLGYDAEGGEIGYI